jgi:hypothetical protein
MKPEFRQQNYTNDINVCTDGTKQTKNRFQALFTNKLRSSLTQKEKERRSHLTSSSFGTKQPQGPSKVSGPSKDDDRLFPPASQIQTRKHELLEKCLEHPGRLDGTSLILDVLDLGQGCGEH